MAKKQVQHGRGWYSRRASFLKRAGIIDWDLRKSLTPAKKSTISRLYKKFAEFDSREFIPVTVKQGGKYGKKHASKTEFVAREGADSVRVFHKRGEIVHTWKQNGTIKRTRRLIQPRPEGIKVAYETFRSRRGGKNRYFMVRRSNATHQSHATIIRSVEAFELYVNTFKERFIRNETIRLKKSGTRGGKKLAQKHMRDIMDSWYIVEYNIAE